jgi:NAD(P)-dependent dehydrogenase (short-subunit alcohol dehydrogenase family)
LKSIGFEAARVIALHAPKQLIFAGRDGARFVKCLYPWNVIELTPVRCSRTEAAITAIRKESPNVDMRALLVDFSSYKSCRDGAAKVLRSYSVVDVLILGHGIMATPYRKTVDGAESQIGTNHFGPFLFTNLIRPVLMKSADPRVVVVTSAGHRRSGIRFDDYNFSDGKEYDKWAAYGQSKTANILFALSIANRWKGVTAFSVHPGGKQPLP